jgi:hypothetical protein
MTALLSGFPGRRNTPDPEADRHTQTSAVIAALELGAGLRHSGERRCARALQNRCGTSWPRGPARNCISHSLLDNRDRQSDHHTIGSLPG